MSKTLVIGASGSIGSEVSRLLKSNGHDVRRATSRKHLDSDQVHLNLLNHEGLKAAVEGIENLFLMAPPGFLNPDEALIPVIEEAEKNGVSKIVLLSALGANEKDTEPLRLVELRLERSGIPYNIIRPNWFMQNFNTYWLGGIKSEGKILLPVEKAKGSFIDTRDIAAVAAELLQSDKFNDQAFDLTGAESLDHDEVAHLLSSVSGRKITYENISPEHMHQLFLQAGLPSEYSEFLLMSLDLFRQGYSDALTDSVEKIIGRKPITFKSYAEDHKEVWAEY